MKKFYLLALATFALAFSMEAQTVLLDETMEFYTLGEMGDQNPAVWTSWTNDGGVTLDGMLVSDAQSIDTKSLLSLGGEGRDPVLLLGNITSGDYTLQFEWYIPTDKEGYFNIQGETPPVGTAFSGVFNSSNIYFNEDGLNPGLLTDYTTGETGSFPHDEWFTVSIYFDVDALNYTMTVDGTAVNAAPVGFQADATLGGINYFPGCACSEYYTDNLLFVEGTIGGTDDFSASNFSVYPNPVQDVLNIRSASTVDAIAVYDVLGKLVLQTAPDRISPTIDMSSLNSGAYLVQVTIGDASKTVKVIK
ncbi:MAG: T9SS type A sorting domain-containing protein [Bacteroidia bacterium]|nr:T9SS type A sorting domain-containing protein [Bacteroidia bacterium]NNM23133.1 T9SS type A sorting domain-containing protein [Flavobacteriaceae bacterium]